MLYVITINEHCQMTATELHYKNIPQSDNVLFANKQKYTTVIFLYWNQYFLMMPIEVLMMVC